MGDLPDLPFKLVLNYLDLGDLIRCRAVSRRWREKVDSIRVESLFFSEWPSGCIINKSRLVVADFVRNYISSPKFESFFGHFGRSLLGRLPATAARRRNEIWILSTKLSQRLNFLTKWISVCYFRRERLMRRF